MRKLINRFLLVLFSFLSSEIYSQAIVDIEQIRKNGEIGIFKYKFQTLRQNLIHHEPL